MNTYSNFGRRSVFTPQTEPIPDTNMTANNGGGFSFQIDDLMRLRRFLVLGSSGGTYYVQERDLTRQNLDVVEKLCKEGKGKQVVDSIVEISHEGRAASNDPALFALAYCTSVDDVEIRTYALNALPKVARTGTHILHFVHYVKQFRSWGRAYKRAIANWYQSKTVEQLAYQVVKYQQRDGYAQRDLLRLAHPKTTDVERNSLYKWIVKGECDEHIGSPLTDPNDLYKGDAAGRVHPLSMIWAYEQAQKTTDDKTIASLIKEYRLPREAIPTEHLKSVRVWEALLEDMPLEAMTRNLAVMTRNGVLENMETFTRSVVTRLCNYDAIHKARLHPIKLLAALTTYESGKSVRGTGTWTPLREIIDALNDAFYLSFKAIEPSGKRMVLALDVSASMTWSTLAGIPGLTPRTSSAAMALVTAASEPNYSIMAFSSGIVPVNISPKQRLDDVVRTIGNLSASATDCSLPMAWAMNNNMKVDAFVVYTDSETNTHGSMHPVQALNLYRQKTGIPAKLIVVGMVSNGFSVADPNDAGMMDVVGFDVNTPNAIGQFLAM